MLVTISCACLLVTDYSATFYVSLTGFTAFFTLFLVLILVSSYTHETCKATSALFRRKMAVSCCFGASGSRQATVLNADGHQVEVDKGSCPNLQQQQQMIASQLMIMSSLESEVRMAPFGLFYLIPAYIMRFFAVMLSYSVILIQTSDQSVHPSDRCNASHF
ncbi:hypothetical protein TYRP_022308 [Tyrophagus putrescentiae]|nr:hypothetical protein TYRP_022308 [Tyrophagus putrescentiae]